MALHPLRAEPAKTSLLAPAQEPKPAMGPGLAAVRRPTASHAKVRIKATTNESCAKKVEGSLKLVRPTGRLKFHPTSPYDAFQADLRIVAGQVALAMTRPLAGCADTGKVAELRRHRLPYILRIDPQELQSLRKADPS
jgi:hypothetical protein